MNISGCNHLPFFRPEMIKKRILIVEDNEATASTLAEYLRMNDFDCDIALGGRDAIRLFKRDPYQIVLLDITLPDIDGLAVGRECIKHRPDTKIVFLTASTADIAGNPVFRKATFLKKPCKAGEILAEVLQS